MSGRREQRWIAAAAGSVALCTALSAAVAAPAKKRGDRTPPPSKATPASVTRPPLTEEQKILHALNRLGFGPRPGDVERVKAMGLDRYLDQQLHPERIPDEKVTAKLASFTMLQATPEQLAQAYTDGLKNAVKLKKLKDEVGQKEGGASAMMGMDAAAMTDAQREQLREILEQGKQGLAVGNAQLQMAKVIRAVDSDRQLYELMVDFWTNHFNIDIRKSQCRAFKIVDDRDVIRPYALGRFRDLLGASAKSPAMLIYLDNAQSQAPQEMPARPGRFQQRRAAAQGQPAPAAPAKRGGINENYARELMELHTLGVDGGYTQQDVQEVARCLTGWSVNRQTGRFQFAPRRHDDGEKTVLGQRIPAGGGIKDGETVLDMLARHPATARYVSRKLCQRLVADEPPAALVERCVAVWQRTDGDLREVVRTIATSPEFYSPTAYRQKIKSPFEYAVSSVRALGGTVELAAGNRRVASANAGGFANVRGGLVAQVGTLGEPLFQCQPPTGYPVDSRKWVSSGALISRLNFSLALAEGRIPGVDLSPAATLAQPAATPEAAIDRIGAQILRGDLTPSTRTTLLKQVGEADKDGQTALARRVAALVLGSPEFQRR